MKKSNWNAFLFWMCCFFASQQALAELTCRSEWRAGLPSFCEIVVGDSMIPEETLLRSDRLPFHFPQTQIGCETFCREADPGKLGQLLLIANQQKEEESARASSRAEFAEGGVASLTLRVLHLVQQRNQLVQTLQNNQLGHLIPADLQALQLPAGNSSLLPTAMDLGGGS